MKISRWRVAALLIGAFVLINLAGTALDAILNWLGYGFKATWPEATWTISALVGGLVAAHNAVSADRDLRDLRSLGMNGAREIVLTLSRTNQRAILFCMVSALIAGIVSLTIAPANPNKPITPPNIVLIATVMLIEIRLVILSLQGAEARRRLMRSVRAGKEGELAPPHELVADTGDVYVKKEAE